MAEGKKKFSIVFVCTGNTCRSPMAEFMFKAYLKEKGDAAAYSVNSAGLYAERGDMLSENADKALTVLGVTHKPRRAKVFTAGMALDSDMVIAMSERHAVECGDVESLYTFEEFGSHRPISDPYGGSLQDYLGCAAQMRECFDEIYEESKKLINCEHD